MPHGEKRQVTDSFGISNGSHRSSARVMPGSLRVASNVGLDPHIQKKWELFFQDYRGEPETFHQLFVRLEGNFVAWKTSRSSRFEADTMFAKAKHLD